jgi:hypothetical protein
MNAGAGEPTGREGENVVVARGFPVGAHIVIVIAVHPRLAEVVPTCERAASERTARYLEH